MNMTKGKWPNGLQAAMDEAEIGPTKLAALVEENKQSINRWAQGARKLPIPVAKKIAPFVKRSVAELLLLPAIPEAPVGGRAGAGGSIIDVHADTSDLDHLAVIAGDPEMLAQISGDSLGVHFEGWFAVLGPRDAWRDSLYGQLCVVETADGQTLIKWVERTKKKGVKLISGDDTVHADGIDIILAAPVIGLRPPRKK